MNPSRIRMFLNFAAYNDSKCAILVMNIQVLTMGSAATWCIAALNAPKTHVMLEICFFTCLKSNLQSLYGIRASSIMAVCLIHSEAITISDIEAHFFYVLSKSVLPLWLS